MLARANRVVRPADFRNTVRRGRRVGTPHTVLYLHEHLGENPTRIGFIVGKNVGGAVTRNLVRRRLRAVGHEVLLARATGSDIVVRALPGSAHASWDTLHDEVAGAIDENVAQ